MPNSDYTKVEIEGKEAALRALAQCPNRIDKMVAKALKYAGKNAAKSIKGNMPDASFKRVVRYKVSKSGESRKLIVGLMNLKSVLVKGKDVKDKAKATAYMAAYWKNYGTLSNRDPQHRFYSARKAKSSKWQGGVPARNFYADAEVSLGEKIRRDFECEMKNQENQLVEDAK